LPRPLPFLASLLPPTDVFGGLLALLTQH